MPSIVVDVTGRCNLNCYHCYASDYRRDHPSVERIKRTVELLPDGLEVIFMGGEPLMRKELPEFIELAAKRGHCVTVVTNATLIDEKTARRLVDSGAVHFQCSLDGSCPEINDVVRGKGTFERALNGIKALDGAVHDVDGLSVCMTVNSLNYDNVRDTLSFLSGQNIYSNIILERTISSGSAVSNDYLVPTDQQWIHACRQMCASWRKWPRLAKMSLMGVPKFVDWLETKYAVVLNEAAYRCPVVEGGVMGRIFPDGRLFSCGQRDILEEASAKGFLGDEGQVALEFLETTHLNGSTYESSKRLLAANIGPGDDPLCKVCAYRNVCSSCPGLNMLGYSSPPEICILIDGLKEPAPRLRETYQPIPDGSGTVEELSIQKDVYWKELRDGGLLVFNPFNKTEIALSAETAGAWRAICSGNSVESLKRGNAESRTDLEASFFVESMIGGMERCGILRDRRNNAAGN